MKPLDIVADNFEGAYLSDYARWMIRWDMQIRKQMHTLTCSFYCVSAYKFLTGTTFLANCFSTDGSLWSCGISASRTEHKPIK